MYGLVLILLSATVCQGQLAEVTGLAGESVRLPCKKDEQKCGALHNIQWYQGEGDTRVYLFSDMEGVDSSESHLEGRGYFHYEEGPAEMELEIRPLKPQDESVYKCELTYLEARESCAVPQLVNLTTLARPESVTIFLDDGSELADGAVIGPFVEGSDLVLRCDSPGGKPAAVVSWWNGTASLGGNRRSEPQEDGTALGINLISLPLRRHHLGSSLQCQANHQALEYPLTNTIHVDLHVRPSKVELIGVDGPITEGDRVTLTCRVSEARPAANITWLVDDEEMQYQPLSSNKRDKNDAVETYSDYGFTATREMNGQRISCLASNPVLEAMEEPPMSAELQLDVQYAPQVTVSPLNITVNESTDVIVFCSFDANPGNITSVSWLKEDERLNLTSDEKYHGGTLEHPALVVKNTTRWDTGRYRCEVTNEIGTGSAENQTTLSVYYPAEVAVLIDPAVVLEEAGVNVTVTCQVIDGRPADLTQVWWYLDGELLRNFTTEATDDCDYVGDDAEDEEEQGLRCGRNPSELLVMEADRDSRGNFSCQGRNAAGIGPISEESELDVLFPPDWAILSYEPSLVIKSHPLTLTCTVNDLGNPPADRYIWMRGTHIITDVTEDQWRIDVVTLEDKTNFTCVSQNKAGSSRKAAVAIDVLAPPQFIQRLPTHLGAPLNATAISTSCHVECSPLCNIHWYRNDENIDDSPFYWVEMTHVDPDRETGDFQSVISTLHWNMSAWPEGRLDPELDSANFTCQSSANLAGPGVSSTALFRVEYAPRNVTVLPLSVDVVEGEIPDKVTCLAAAHPPPTYHWKYGDDVILAGDELRLVYPEGMSRDRAGAYLCHAQNKHGTASAPATVNVLYKPDCTLEQHEEDGEMTLVCVADAVPADVTFTWRFNNETLTEGVATEGARSRLTVPGSARGSGVYYCLVNNTVGPGKPCETDVAVTGGWMLDLSDPTVIVVIVVVVVLILLLILLCIVCLCCRRRKLNKEKSNPQKTSPNGVPEDKAVYENLPFHGMQQPPTKPLGPWSDMDYADANYKAYGPIDYKQESQKILDQKRSNQEAAQIGAPPRPPKT